MKYSNPFGIGNQLWITQTYHTNSSNTAIDCYGAKYRANLPVYAIADGTITSATLGGNAYCMQSVDNSDHKIFYVHTWNWLPVGTKIKKGEKIAEIAPKSVNGGFPEHLHLGLQRGLNIMDYFDRDIAFRTKYADIKKSWFLSDTKIDWSKHKDLSYTDLIASGTKLEQTSDMNVRDKNFKIIGSAKKGSVCEVISYYKENGGYSFYIVKFADKDCYIADSNFNKKTTKDVTNLDGSKPFTCEDKIIVLNEEIDRLELIVQAQRTDLDKLTGDVEQLQKYKEYFEQLSILLETKI